MSFRFLLFLQVTFIGNMAAQTVELAGNARFILQDQSAFKEFGYDDSRWKTVDVPASWSSMSLGPAEQKFGWYRIHFKAPKSIQNKPCMLLAGIIDDSDETYLNGVLIGKTGKFPPNDQTAWDVQRKYDIAAKLLKDSNVLAIKVFNGVGDGGLYAGQLRIMTRKNYDQYLKKKRSDLHSYHQLTTSNGLVSAVYNDESNGIEAFYPHIFSYHDSARAVLPVLTKLQPNLATLPYHCAYLDNTHIIEVRYPDLVLYYFASFTRQDKALYVLARGKRKSVSKLDFRYEQGNARVFRRSSGSENGNASEKYFIFTFTDELHPEQAPEKGIQPVAHALLEDERSFMRSVIDHCRLPGKLSVKEKNVAEQSIAILKMSQVSDKEVYPLSHGQILASLRPGVWAISWVRDAAYAIQAMNRVGMFEEARKGLLFMLKAAPSGQYERYVHNDGVDYGIGVPYQISVTRYFGNGREESDYSGTYGPNIEIDDFGLFLIAFCHYIRESGDLDFYNTWRTMVHEKVATPIIHNLTAQHILRRDSGPWEHHLPGKQFVFTNAVCARGLQMLDELDRQFGKPDPNMAENVQKMLKGIDAQFLVGNRFYKGNAQESSPDEHYFFDGATFEIFACGLVNDKSLFRSHMLEYDRHLLAAKDPARGYIRFDSQDSYENQEWPFAGLRVAVAEKRLGSVARSRQLIDRITGFASRNHNQIPEIIGLEELDYKGAIPMVGYGAGAYLLALAAYFE